MQVVAIDVLVDALRTENVEPDRRGTGLELRTKLELRHSSHWRWRSSV